MFPTSEHEYFLKVVDARWVFSNDANGSVAAVTLYQNGQEQFVKRLDDVEGWSALATSIEVEKRIKEQTAAPGSEVALRHLIAGLGSGKPNYDEMVPAFAQITRQELPALQESIVRVGPLQSVSFKGVGPAGGDIYEVTFERTAREFRILLDPDGRIHAAQFSP